MKAEPTSWDDTKWVVGALAIFLAVEIGIGILGSLRHWRLLIFAAACLLLSGCEALAVAASQVITAPGMLIEGVIDDARPSPSPAPKKTQ